MREAYNITVKLFNYTIIYKLTICCFKISYVSCPLSRRELNTIIVIQVCSFLCREQHTRIYKCSVVLKPWNNNISNASFVLFMTPYLSKLVKVLIREEVCKVMIIKVFGESTF